ncbi:MAG: NAD(P)H-dependent oxidoreductase [Flavobacteriaceae bacterium]|nr:NAD(P)H-dependent oxidoreductase [Flavobacteriaceae bacterium]
MKKVIAFAGTNSKSSINKQLATYAVSQLKEVTVEVLDLNDFELPLYSIEYEMEHGVPNNAQLFLDKIKTSNGIVLALAEHNGAYTVAFKNLFDWMSRIEGKLWNNVPMLLMASSPGARGGATVLEIAKGRFPYMGGHIISDFSLPSFAENFSEGKIINTEIDLQLKHAIATFENAI